MRKRSSRRVASTIVARVAHEVFVPLVALGALGACDPGAPAPRRCISASDCEGGDLCVDGRCVQPDASVADVGSGVDATADADPGSCTVPCMGDMQCVRGRCEPWPIDGFDPACRTPPRPFAVAPRVLCHWPPAGADLTQGPPEWRWARRVASTVVAAPFLPLMGEFDLPPTWLVFATGSVLGSSAEEPARFSAGGVLRVLDPQTCTLVDTLEEAPVAAWFQPPAIGDLDGDGIPEIVAQRWVGDLAGSDPSYASRGELVAWRWDMALARFRIVLRSTVAGVLEADLAYTAGYTVMAGPTIADLDDDGMPEVIVSGRVYDHELRRLTGEAPPVTPLFMSRAPPGGPFVIQEDVIADLDDDGRAELVYGHAIFSWAGASGWTPATFFSPPVALGVAHAVVAELGDLTGSPAGRPEIVAVGYDGVRIQTIDGTVLRTFALPTGDRGGSAPSIANVDGDAEPEILVGVDQGIFVYDLGCDVAAPGPECQRDASATTGLPALPRGVRWADWPPRDAWDFMGATTFDFDADGDVEVVYADECFLRVYDGPTGEVLYSHWRPSRTASEVPIVVGTGGGADTVLAIGLHTARFCDQATGVGGVPPYDPQFPGLTCEDDRDCFGPAGSCRAGRCRCTADAECCAPGTSCPSVGFACHPADDGDGSTCRAVRIPDPSTYASFGALEEGIDVLTDAFGRWAPSRPIWNQDAYSITNVRDDGTIPRTSEVVPSWSAAGGSSFRSNAAAAGGARAAADLTVAFSTGDCEIVTSGVVAVRVCNRGARAAPAGQSVRVTEVDDGLFVCETVTPAAIRPGACVPVECGASGWGGGRDLRVEVASEGRLPECGEPEGNAAILFAPGLCV